MRAAMRFSMRVAANAVTALLQRAQQAMELKELRKRRVALAYACRNGARQLRPLDCQVYLGVIYDLTCRVEQRAA